MNISFHDLNVIGPHLFILATVCVMIVMEALRPKYSGNTAENHIPAVGILGSVMALFYLIISWESAVKEQAFGGMAVMDTFAIFFNILILISTILTILVSTSYLRKEESNRGEFYILTMAAAFGMMILVSSQNLVMIFLGLEVMSISIYVLAGFITRRIQCNESALKYFLLGAFATGFLLYGMALLYGASGSLHLSEIGKIDIMHNNMAIIGMGLLLVGLSFKIASFPFHMWTPDVYDGAPITVTGFMAVGVKAAAFAALMRVVLDLFPSMGNAGYALLWGMAVLTMTYGNFAALAQRNIKRMLAYSSIAHTGYLLVGIISISKAAQIGYVGAEGVLYYLFAYSFMNIGAFGVVAYLAKKDETAFDLESLNGLGKRNPALALAMGVFMFSLAGIPPLAGFFGKFYVFSAAVNAELYGLAIIGVLNSALSVYYYIRIVWYMYFNEAKEGAAPLTFERGNSVALFIAAIFTLLMGLLPSFWIYMAKESIEAVVRNF